MTSKVAPYSDVPSSYIHLLIPIYQEVWTLLVLRWSILRSFVRLMRGGECTRLTLSGRWMHTTHPPLSIQFITITVYGDGLRSYLLSNSCLRLLVQHRTSIPATATEVHRWSMGRAAVHGTLRSPYTVKRGIKYSSRSVLLGLNLCF